MALAEPQNDFEVPEWTLGERLRKARRHAKLTQEQMAEAIGVGAKRYANWEADGAAPVNKDLFDVCKRVELATGFPAEWLAGFRTGSSRAPLRGLPTNRSPDRPFDGDGGSPTLTLIRTRHT